MKKIFATIICAALLIAAAGVFTGCGVGSAGAVTTDLFSAAAMEKELSEFLKANPDRTSQTKKDADGKDGEELASEWLETTLGGVLGADNVSRKSFSHIVEGYGDEFESFNVVGTVSADEGKNTDNYRIVIGASYDNEYETVRMSKYDANYFTAKKAEGAMANGTGVATVLQLARYFSQGSVRSKLTVDIDFAFYGMGCIDLYGSSFYRNGLGETGRSKLLLAVNVDSLGGDKLYAYFDEAATAHGNFILEAATDAGVGGAISEPPAMTADMGYEFTDALPYTPFPLVSDASTYFGNHNICALTSGSDNTFFLYDRESGNGENLAFTGADTLAALKGRNPDYSAQMAVAAETIATAVTKDGFVQTCLDSMAGIGGYAWMNYPLAGYITVAVLALIATVIIVVLVRRYESKHREDPEIKRNVKVAVFGMDYEEPKDDDVFVDIRSHESADPFADAFDDVSDHDDKPDKN